jgi:hypothetical protein
MRRPAFPGQIRKRVYTFDAFEIDVQPDDKKWVARCNEYWAVQEIKFGLKLGAIAVVPVNAMRTVLTYARVDRIIAGERVPPEMWRRSMVVSR